MKRVYPCKIIVLGSVPLSALCALFILGMAFASSSTNAAAHSVPKQTSGPAVTITHTVGFDPAVCPTMRQATVAAGTDLYFCLLMTNIGDVQFTTYTMTRVLESSIETTRENYRFTFKLDPGESISFTNKSLFDRFGIEDAFELIELADGTDIDVEMTANTAFVSASVTATSDAKVDVVDVLLTRHVGTTVQSCPERNKIGALSATPVYHCYEVKNSGSVTVTVERIEDALFNSPPALDLQIGPNETISYGAVAGIVGEVVTMPTADSTYTATVYAAAAGISVSNTASSEVELLDDMLYVPILQNPSLFVEEQTLWEAQNLTSYEMVQRVSCFCPPPFKGQLIVENGQIVSGVDFDTRDPLSAAELNRFRTINQLFDILEGAEALPATRLDTTFHPTQGYPTGIGIDYVLEIADDEISYQVTFLEPWP